MATAIAPTELPGVVSRQLGPWPVRSGLKPIIASVTFAEMVGRSALPTVTSDHSVDADVRVQAPSDHRGVLPIHD